MGGLDGNAVFNSYPCLSYSFGILFCDIHPRFETTNMELGRKLARNQAQFSEEKEEEYAQGERDAEAARQAAAKAAAEQKEVDRLAWMEQERLDRIKARVDAFQTARTEALEYEAKVKAEREEAERKKKEAEAAAAAKGGKKKKKKKK